MSDNSTVSLTRMDTSKSKSSDENHEHRKIRIDFINQLQKLEDLMENYNTKIINKTLCSEDLDNMKKEMTLLKTIEKKVTRKIMKSNYVTYKMRSLKLIQESYRICSWLLEKECEDMDNVFSIDSFVNKIFEKCADKENPLEHLNTLFEGCILNASYINLNFYGNISSEASLDQSVSTQLRKEYKRSQKRPSEDQVVPVEVDSATGDTELDFTLRKVHKCLKRAIKNNQGRPINFYKFAIDPFSLTYTVENLFYLASLMKDNMIKIGIDSDNGNEKFTFITTKGKNPDISKNPESIPFKINYDIWQSLIRKYNITERMIVQ